MNSPADVSVWGVCPTLPVRPRPSPKHPFAFWTRTIQNILSQIRFLTTRSTEFCFDADNDFFQKQKQDLEAAHRIEKHLNESKRGPPEVESILAPNHILCPVGICTPKY